jgi:hypothetical protein
MQPKPAVVGHQARGQMGVGHAACSISPGVMAGKGSNGEAAVDGQMRSGSGTDTGITGGH